MTVKEAIRIPIPDVFAKLGYTPVRKDKGGMELVYHSPFRKDSVPSLFVNVRKNVWNDFGERGGNILNFIMLHENTDLSGALDFLGNLYTQTEFKAIKIANPTTKQLSETETRDKTFIQDDILPLKSTVLENYLTKRFINIQTAKNYLKVVRFHHAKTKIKYFGLGLKNLSGGYEVRNPTLKTVIGKKDVSFIKGKSGNEDSAATEIIVFEGFMDFLSFLADKKKQYLESDVLILNSTKMVDRAKTFITEGQYERIYTFFDNDRAGEEAGISFSTLEKQLVPCNPMYQGFKDYGEYWEFENEN